MLAYGVCSLSRSLGMRLISPSLLVGIMSCSMLALKSSMTWAPRLEEEVLVVVQGASFRLLALSAYYWYTPSMRELAMHILP